MQVRKFVENNSPSQNIFNLHCGIQRGKIIKFEELWEFWDNWDKLAASESGAQMKVIDAKKKYIKKSRGTIPLKRCVADLNRFDSDSDLTFHFDADPDHDPTVCHTSSYKINF